MSIICRGARKLRKYDARDVERVRSDDAYIKCFIRSFGDADDPEKATDMINEVLLFRKDICING